MKGLALFERGTVTERLCVCVCSMSYYFQTLMITQDFCCILRLVDIVRATSSENYMKAGISRSTYKTDSPQSAHIV